MPPGVSVRRSPYAAAALVLVIANVILCPILCIPAIVVARLARRDARQNRIGGERMAVVAEVIAWIEVVLLVFFGILGVGLALICGGNACQR